MIRKRMAGPCENQDLSNLESAIRIHTKIAILFEEHGARGLANDEWKKVSMLKYERQVLYDNWEWNDGPSSV